MSSSMANLPAWVVMLRCIWLQLLSEQRSTLPLSTLYGFCLTQLALTGLNKNHTE
jgi:hypothetical protein